MSDKPKIELNPTQTEPVEKAETSDVILTDARGRKLKLQEPEILQESRIVRLMGESSSNQAYMMGYVMPAVSVVEIDGNPVAFPVTEKEVEFAITRLGKEGIAAVMGHYNAQMKAAIAAAEEGRARQNEVESAVKN